MSNIDRPPTWRKPVGILSILAIIILWAILIVSFADQIGQLPIVAQTIIYLVAGIIWIAPMRPLMIWMETGSFKAPSTID